MNAAPVRIAAMAKGGEFAFEESIMDLSGFGGAQALGAAWRVAGG